MSDLELHNAPDRKTELVEPGDAFARLERRRLAATLTGHYDVIVIGGGQAGLVTGYHLQRAGLRFLILDAGERIGDSWRRRWDSLRLFTPSRYDALSGMAFRAVSGISRPRIKWRATSRLTPRNSHCRCGCGRESSGCPSKTACSCCKAMTSRCAPTRSSSQCRAINVRACPNSRAR